MNPACLLLVALITAEEPGGTAALAADPWFSQDKFMHLYASASICGFSYYLCNRLGSDRDRTPNAVYSISLTALVGLSKETCDRVRKNKFSWRDLCWDAAGIGLGYLLFVRAY